jgi:hypothetical protein
MHKRLIVFLIGVLLMARGLPDYANPEYGVVSTLIDNADLVVFNTGFARLDGGGRMVSFNDFRAGWHQYDDQAFGGAASPVMDFSEKHMHGFAGSVRLDPVVNGGIAAMVRTSYIPFSGKIGLEVGFYPSLNVGDFIFRLAYSPSVGVTNTAGFYIPAGTSNVRIEIPASTVLVYTETQVQEWADSHIAIKLVFDPFAQKYDNIIIAGVRQDISSYSVRTSAAGLVSRVSEIVIVNGSGATNIEPGWLEYVILTADEP